jgi:hypothetical protein
MVFFTICIIGIIGFLGELRRRKSTLSGSRSDAGVHQGVWAPWVST